MFLSALPQVLYSSQRILTSWVVSSTPMDLSTINIVVMPNLWLWLNFRPTSHCLQDLSIGPESQYNAGWPNSLPHHPQTATVPLLPDSFSGTTIQPVTQARYLGVILLLPIHFPPWSISHQILTFLFPKTSLKSVKFLPISTFTALIMTLSPPNWNTPIFPLLPHFLYIRESDLSKMPVWSCHCHM